jgi:imidazolonepropionase-like amidohydrolase
LDKYFLLCVIFFLYLSAGAQYYLDHIHIIDVEKGTVSKEQSVLIDSNRIKTISSSLAKNPKLIVYDCSGKYLISGLWDMHIHDADDDSSNRYEYVPLFLANGVTGIRDMWGSEEMLKLKNDIDAGRFIGPRMVIGSPIIEGDK